MPITEADQLYQKHKSNARFTKAFKEMITVLKKRKEERIANQRKNRAVESSVSSNEAPNQRKNGAVESSVSSNEALKICINRLTENEIKVATKRHDIPIQKPNTQSSVPKTLKLCIHKLTEDQIERATKPHTIPIQRPYNLRPRK